MSFSHSKQKELEEKGICTRCGKEAAEPGSRSCGYCKQENCRIVRINNLKKKIKQDAAEIERKYKEVENGTDYGKKNMLKILTELEGERGISEKIVEILYLKGHKIPEEVMPIGMKRYPEEVLHPELRKICFEIGKEETEEQKDRRGGKEMIKNKDLEEKEHNMDEMKEMEECEKNTEIEKNKKRTIEEIKEENERMMNKKLNEKVNTVTPRIIEIVRNESEEIKKQIEDMKMRMEDLENQISYKMEYMREIEKFLEFMG